ncbi:MAG: cytochrome c3 family protein [Candidatus Bipolaricaulia bacterium]
MLLRVLAALTVLLSWGELRGVGQEQNSCLVCHSEIKVEYLEGVHRGFGVTCIDCHGGDPTTLEMQKAHALEAFFRGAPQRAEIPELCASCHSDPIKMKPYGLRTDQYAEYQTSQHGKLLAQGDTKVAVCSDCHTAHKILPAWEPRSTVHAENIPSTCARCHSDTKLMEPYGIPTNQFEGFRQSVHGTALLDQGNTKAPSCATCHGTHGAAPPGVEDVSTVCGTCHSNERLYFNTSPHKKPMDEQRISECASCHSNHQIEPTNRTLLDRACLACHSPDSKEQRVSQKIKTLLLGAQEALEEATQLFEQAQQKAVDVSAYHSRLVEARSYFLQALPVQHSLDIAQIEELTRRAKSIADDVRGGLHSLQGVFTIRLLGLTLVWVFLLLLMIVIYLVRRERRGERL